MNKNIKEIKGKSQRIPKNINRPKIDKKERSKSETTGFEKFYFGQKLVMRSSFRGHKFYAKKKYQRNKRKKSKNP